MGIVDEILEKCKSGDIGACTFMFENAEDIDMMLHEKKIELLPVKDDAFYDKDTLIKGMMVEF